MAQLAEVTSGPKDRAAGSSGEGGRRLGRGQYRQTLEDQVVGSVKMRECPADTSSTNHQAVHSTDSKLGLEGATVMQLHLDQQP